MAEPLLENFWQRLINKSLDLRVAFDHARRVVRLGAAVPVAPDLSPSWGALISESFEACLRDGHIYILEAFIFMTACDQVVE